MKLTSSLFFIIILFTQISCDNKETPVEIDYIITNDYLSERNLSMMGGVVTNTYKKGLVDSLRNCFVETFDKGLISSKKYFNEIGAQYQTNLYFYSAKERLQKVLEINEYFNDTTTYQYQYKDSADLMIQKTIINKGKEKTRLDFYYTYNTSAAQNGITLFENGQLIYKDSIKDVSATERHINSYDSAGRLSTYIIRQNEKELKVYEKTSKWDYVFKGDYFEIIEELEYLYKYDKNGNWIERIKQSFCPPQKDTTTQQPDSVAIVKTETYFDKSCKTEVKEKLIRKIYYKKR